MRKLMAVVLISALTCLTSSAWAQGCAVCTKTAANLDSKGARGLNGGILYLAFLPLAIMGTVGFMWWRGNKSEKR
jgi:hypothetical protein